MVMVFETSGPNQTIKPEFRKKLTSLSRLFATDRWFQFHKPREFFIGTHNEAFSDAIRSFYHVTYRILRIDSLLAQRVDSRCRYSSGSPSRMILPCLDEGQGVMLSSPAAPIVISRML